MLTDFVFIGIILLFTVLLLSFFWFFVAGFFRSPFVPSNTKTIQKMLEIANLQKGEKIVDLGCGDGRLLFAAEKEFGTSGIGYEISIFVWSLANLKKCFKKSRVEILRTDLFTADLREVDVVFCYLLPAVMARLAPKLQKELKPGARIISASFALPGFQLIQEIPAEKWQKRVLIYRQD